MYTREDPFKAYEAWDEFYQAIVVRKERPPLPPQMPRALSSLIQACWADDQKTRPLFPSVIYQLDQVCSLPLSSRCFFLLQAPATTDCAEAFLRVHPTAIFFANQAYLPLSNWILGFGRPSY